MLSFGLKLAWFALSLSGLIGCWAVLLPLAWAVQSYWGPIAYAVGITGIEGMFCLGLIWRMSPASMPASFCLASTIITTFATFILTGVLAAITTATSLHAVKPKQWGLQRDIVLPWNSYYLLPMILFPLLASAVHITFVIFFGRFEPFDGLSCISRPLWIHFLGFAGTPFLITIPCLWMTVISVIRVLRTHKHIRRSRRSVPIDYFTEIPPRKSRPTLAPRSTPPTPLAITTPSPSASVIANMTRDPRRQLISPELREHKTRSYHLPFTPPSPSYRTASSGDCPHGSNETFDTISTVSFAEMTKSTRTPNEDEIRTPLRSFTSPNGTGRTHISSHSIRNSDRMSITELAFRLGRADSSSDFVSLPRHVSILSPPPPIEHRNPSEISSTIWSLMMFQFAIIGIHLLSSLTPIIESISSRSVPSAFGTQHVALILAGWAPVVVFAPLSVVRRQLKFTRR